MLPNLIVVGAAKAGTTSLYHYLKLHPEVHMSPVKELRFFVEEMNWGRGVEWYESHFASDRPVRGEASPQYSSCTRFRGVPERMASVVPGARIVYLVRDPIARLEAEYLHRRAARWENRPLAEAVADRASAYVDNSRYATQLAAFDRCFSRERILVVDQHDLLHDRARQMAEIHAFLGVDPSFASPGYARRHNRRYGAGRQTERGRRAWDVLVDRAGHDRAHLVHGGLLRAWEAATRRPAPAPRLGGRARAEVARQLAGEAAALRERTGRRFATWEV